MQYTEDLLRSHFFTDTDIAIRSDALKGMLANPDPASNGAAYDTQAQKDALARYLGYLYNDDAVSARNAC